MDNHPIFILGCTKSGTTLMRNLFDGHPDLFVIPFESHFFELTGYSVSYYLRRTAPKSMDLSAKKAALSRWIEIMNSKENRLADAFVQGRINPEIASTRLNECRSNDDRELLDAYADAIFRGVHGSAPQEGMNYVEKSVENSEFVLDIVRAYPKARFVHILRNPYSNLVAIRKYSAIQQYGSPKVFPKLRSAIFSMLDSYQDLYRNTRLVDNYHVLKYEDLLTDPEKSMRELATRLEIDYSESLVTPTLLGQPWGGNSTSGGAANTVSKTNLERWKSEITPIEAYIVKQLFGHVVDDYGFDHAQVKQGVYRPNKGEKLKDYTYNRLLLKFMPSWDRVIQS